MKIVVDAMGGDNAPSCNVKGALNAIREYGVEVVLVGRGEEILASLKEQGINVRVLDMATIKPLDREAVIKAAQETGCIVTTEEANVLGGLGAAVTEYLAGVCPTPVVRHGVEDEFGRSGVAPKGLEAYGITAAGIVEKVKKAIALKK